MGDFDTLVFEQELSEVFLLMDFVSGRPDKHLTDLNGKLPRPDRPGEMMTAAEVVERVALLKSPSSSDAAEAAKDVAFLLSLKDVLNSMVYPARGLTIAYTIMFAGEGGGDHSETNRVQAAQRAFPGLVASAAKLRQMRRSLTSWGVGLTLFSAIFLWQVTYGVQLASRFEEVRQNEGHAAASVYDALEKSTRGLRGAPIGLLDRVCGTKAPPVVSASLVAETSDPDPALELSPEVRQLCNDYAYQHSLFKVTIADVGEYSKSWMFAVSRWLLPVHTFIAPDCQSADCVRDALGRQEDAQSVSGMLATMINYMLPILFGLVGTVAALVRGIQDRATASTLDPRDRALSLIRLPLGMMAGVCAGLFLSPTAVSTQVGGGLRALTLSASGIAFLAGYGAEGFFRMLDTILGRVFGLENGARAGR